MNKKLVALLIPLLMMPLVGFAYAHWYDSVTKNIKMHVGTVDIEIVQWHVDKTNTYDADCDGVIEGDELKIEEVWVDELGQRQLEGIRIAVDPIYPCWILEFKFIVHNKGRLVLEMSELESEWGWGGPYSTDPCWGRETGAVPPGFQYTVKLYKHVEPIGVTCPKPCLDKTHYTLEVQPTTFHLKPCESILVYQYIHFLGQDYPQYQCNWFRLWYKIGFREWIGPEWGSYGWP